MVKMVSLRKSKPANSDKLPSPEPYQDDGGVTVHLDHHHLSKMGIGGDLKSGNDVEFHGRGTVERSETQSSKDGDRHSATIRLHRAGVEHQGGDDDARSDLRNELVRQSDKAEAKSAR